MTRWREKQMEIEKTQRERELLGQTQRLTETLTERQSERNRDGRFELVKSDTQRGRRWHQKGSRNKQRLRLESRRSLGQGMRLGLGCQPSAVPW